MAWKHPKKTARHLPRRALVVVGLYGLLGLALRRTLELGNFLEHCLHVGPLGRSLAQQPSHERIQRKRVHAQACRWTGYAADHSQVCALHNSN